MPAQRPIRVLHVHLGPGPSVDAPGLSELVRALRDRDEIRQAAVLTGRSSRAAPEPPLPGARSREVDVDPGAGPGFLPASLRPGALLAVGRSLGELIDAPAGRRRAVQWPVPERWAVVHAHGVDALRAVWLAAAWRGCNPRLLASPLPGGDPARAGPWRRAELVAAPDREAREALARRGVERRRLRVMAPGDAEGALGHYRRLATGERRRVQPVDWTLAEPGGGGRPEQEAAR